MGTHATARLQQGEEFIDFHTRWDGFEEETRQIITDLCLTWSSGFQIFSDLCKQKNVELTYINDWIRETQAFISTQKDDPTIDGYGALFCARSFIHYAPMAHSSPHKGDWYAYSDDLTTEPDFEIQIPRTSQNSEASEAPQWKYGRITMYDSFVDFKFNADEIDLVKAIVTLPQFWRVLYFLGASAADDLKLAHENVWKLKRVPPFRQIDKLNSFTPKTPTSKLLYSSMSKIKSHSGNSKEYLAALENVNAEIPFDLSCASFIGHLCFRLPGVVYPLRHSEIDLKRSIDFSVEIKGDRLYALQIDIPGNNLSDNKDDINAVSDQIEMDFAQFAQLHTTGSHLIRYHGMSAEIPYEESIVHFMEPLKELKATAKRKRKKPRNSAFKHRI